MLVAHRWAAGPHIAAPALHHRRAGIDGSCPHPAATHLGGGIRGALHGLVGRVLSLEAMPPGREPARCALASVPARIAAKHLACPPTTAAGGTRRTAVAGAGRAVQCRGCRFDARPETVWSLRMRRAQAPPNGRRVLMQGQPVCGPCPGRDTPPDVGRSCRGAGRTAGPAWPARRAPAARRRLLSPASIPGEASRRRS